MASIDPLINTKIETPDEDPYAPAKEKKPKKEKKTKEQKAKEAARKRRQPYNHD